MRDRGLLQGAQADAPADGLHRDERERGQVADMDGSPHSPTAALPQVPLRMGQGVLAPRRNRAFCRVDGSGHRGNPAPLWDGITPASTATSLRPAVFGGLLSRRSQNLWDSIFANGGVPPRLWNKTTRKTTAKANEIRASVRQLRLYGMIVVITLKNSA